MNEKEWVDDLLQDLFIQKIAIEDVFGACLKNVPKETRFYKYYSLDSDFTIENLKNDIIYFSDPTTFNDPFECNWGVSADAGVRFLFSSLFSIDICSMENLTIQNVCKLAEHNGDNIPQGEIDKAKNVSSKIQEKMKAYFSPMMGISCFSESKDDILMWSHYANKHSGICVEYDFSGITTGDLLLFPVNYSLKRPQAPLEKIWKFEQGRNEDIILEIACEMMKCFLTKSYRWEYEREWRLIIFENKNIKRKRILPCAKKIVMGNNISEEHFQVITHIAKEKKFELEKATLSPDEFAIKICDINL